MCVTFKPKTKKKQQLRGWDQTVDNKPEMLEVSKNMHHSYF